MDADPEGDLIAINILIEPDAATRELARVMNARLRQAMPEGFALDATHMPHVTVLQRYVRSAELEQVLGAIEAIVADPDLTSLRLRATRIAYAEWDPQGIGISSLMLGRDSRLLEAQAGLIVAVAPFAAAGGTATAFATDRDDPSINAATQRYVERFVPDHSGSRYEPHLSLGMGRLGALDALAAEPFEPCDVRARAVAVFQLGNNGTARRRLRAWPAAAQRLDEPGA